MSVPRRVYDAKRASRSSTFSSLARQRARGRFRDSREENVMPVSIGRRVAVIAGCRTPFCRSGTVLKDARAVDLARFVARELLERTNLDGADVNAVIFGQVVPSALVPNVAREVSLLPQFPKERSEEHTSELQSQSNLVCRLLLEKKNINKALYPFSR